MSVLERCPSQGELCFKKNTEELERQGPTASVRFRKVSIKRELTVFIISGISRYIFTSGGLKEELAEKLLRKWKAIKPERICGMLSNMQWIRNWRDCILFLQVFFVLFCFVLLFKREG